MSRDTMQDIEGLEGLEGIEGFDFGELSSTGLVRIPLSGKARFNTSDTTSDTISHNEVWEVEGIDKDIVGWDRVRVIVEGKYRIDRAYNGEARLYFQGALIAVRGIRGIEGESVIDWTEAEKIGLSASAKLQAEKIWKGQVRGLRWVKGFKNGEW